MPNPIQGLIAIAEYGSKFEADAAVGLLTSAGIDATPSYDPAMNSVATYFASDRVFEVLVREADAERATVMLDQARGSLPPEFDEDWAPITSRSRSIARGVLIVGGIAVLLPLVIGFVAFLVVLFR